MASKGFKFSMIQLLVGADKAANLLRAGRLVREAASKGAQVVALPECFNSPYGTSYFPEYAESIPGESTNTLAALAKETKTYLIGGSIPERDGDKLFNTCTVFNPEGKMVAKYRKMHLFDIDVPGKIRFQESETLSPGCELAKFKTEWCSIGLGICYDLRFPELTRFYALQECRFVCFPGASNMTTVLAHWELLICSRALDNQVYAAGVSVARDESASYVS